MHHNHSDGPCRRFPILDCLCTLVAATTLLAACGKPSEKPAATATAEPPAAASSAPTASVPAMTRADLAVLPLTDETWQSYGSAYELRHFGRVVTVAAASPFASFTERDPFAVDGLITAMKLPLSRSFLPKDALGAAQMLNVRYLVLPALKRGPDKTMVGRISVLDCDKGTTAVSEVFVGKPDDFSPREAQRVLLEAGLAAAPKLILLLGGKGGPPPKAVPSPPASEAGLAQAEALLESWDVRTNCQALELAAEALGREPGDARAWALAARGYARLAEDTRASPARFHRECRLRATVAGLMALRLAPEDPEAKFAAATAFLAAHRVVEAEKLLQSLGPNSKHAPEVAIALARMRYNAVLLPPLKPAVSTSQTSALAYRLAQAKVLVGRNDESRELYSALQRANPLNVTLAIRVAGCWGRSAHPANHCSTSQYAALLAASQALADVLPRIATSDPGAKRLVLEALTDLRKVLGDVVPSDLDNPAKTARLQSALDFFSKKKGDPTLPQDLDSLAPNGTPWKLTKTYGRLSLRFADGQSKQALVSGKPLGLSVLDRVRIQDRLVVEGLSETSLALADLGDTEVRTAFAVQLDEAFPADEAAQCYVGDHYRIQGSFSSGKATEHYNKSRAAWIHYLPALITRVSWGRATGTPQGMVSDYRIIAQSDPFDPRIAAVVADGFSDLKQHEEAARFIARAVENDPHGFGYRTKQLYIERQQTGKQLTKEAIEKLAGDFPDQPDMDETRLALYGAAGLAHEIEPLARALLKKEPSNEIAFNHLVFAFRSEGRTTESETLILPYVKQHPDLRGDRALVDTADYYLARREYDRAAEFVRRNQPYLDLSPGWAMVMMARLQWFKGDPKSALAMLETCYTRYGTTDVMLTYAELEALRGNWESLLTLGEKAIQARRTEHGGYWMKGLYHLHKGNADEGQRAVAGGVSAMPHDPEAYQAFALWQFYRGNFAGVVNACADGRRYVTATYHPGLDQIELRARLLSNETSGAEKIVLRTKLLAPLAGTTCGNEAIWALHRGDVAGARQAIDRVRRHNPRDTLTQTMHGRVLLAEGKPNDAIAELRYAADHLHRPWQGTETYYRLAQACEAAGRRDEARKAYEQLAALWPVGWWGDQARAALKR